jgi:hypothetical protein
MLFVVSFEQIVRANDAHQPYERGLPHLRFCFLSYHNSGKLARICALFLPVCATEHGQIG